MAMWLDHDQIMSLPNSGSYWNAMKSAADTNPTPHLGQKDVTDGSVCLAKAYVYHRNNDSSYRTSGIALLNAAMLTLEENEDGLSSSRAIAPSRNVCPYIIAAQLLDLTGADLTSFNSWVNTCCTTTFDDGKTIRSTYFDKPNNWGTFAGASCIARALYLADATELATLVDVYKGWLGDRAVYSGFTLWGGLCWQSDQGNPRAINPVGARVSGAYVDGCLPEEMRRWDGSDGEDCAFQQNPFPTINYNWTALQGTIVAANLLAKAGYPVRDWSDRAIKRAYKWLHKYDLDTAVGDDKFQYPLVDYLLNTTYWANAGSPAVGTGKNMSWTDWSHGLRLQTNAHKSLAVLGVRA